MATVKKVKKAQDGYMTALKKSAASDSSRKKGLSTGLSGNPLFKKASEMKDTTRYKKAQNGIVANVKKAASKVVSTVKKAAPKGGNPYKKVADLSKTPGQRFLSKDKEEFKSGGKMKKK